MERQSKALHESGNKRLGRIISRSVKFIVIILAITVISGASIFIFRYYNQNKSLEFVQLLEGTDKTYNEIIHPSLNEDQDNNSDKANEQEKSNEDTIINLIDKYSQLLEKQTKGFGVQETHYRIAKLYIKLGDLEKASIHFENSLNLGDDKSFLQPKILANIAAIKEEQGLIDEAQNYYLQITDQYTKSIEYPHAKFSLGRIAEGLDKKNGTQTAQGIYISLVEDDNWKNSSWASLSKSRLAVLGYTKYSSGENSEKADNQNTDSDNSEN